MRLNHRARILLACCVVALTAFGWYATRTVRPPDCEVAFSAFVGADGQPLGATWKELDEKAYRDMVASGRCAPPAERWRHWLG